MQSYDIIRGIKKVRDKVLHEQIGKGIPLLRGLKKGFTWKQIESKLDG